jgi:hypothetical protein
MNTDFWFGLRREAQRHAVFARLITFILVGLGAPKSDHRSFASGAIETVREFRNEDGLGLSFIRVHPCPAVVKLLRE